MANVKKDASGNPLEPLKIVFAEGVGTHEFKVKLAPGGKTTAPEAKSDSDMFKIAGGDKAMVYRLFNRGVDSVRRGAFVPVLSEIEKAANRMVALGLDSKYITGELLDAFNVAKAKAERKAANEDSDDEEAAS